MRVEVNKCKCKLRYLQLISKNVIEKFTFAELVLIQIVDT